MLCTSCGSTGASDDNQFGGATSSTSGQHPVSLDESSDEGDASSAARTAESGESEVIFDVGSGDEPEPPALTCATIGEFEATSVGCEFWAVHQRAGPSTYDSLAIGVGNPWDEDVIITLEDMRGPGGTLREIEQITLAPRTSSLVQVSGEDGLLPDAETIASGLNEKAAYRVTADLPITAMQINPSLVAGGSAEASLLLPSNALDRSHMTIGYGGNQSRLVVVATRDGTTVTVPGLFPVEEVVLDAFDVYRWVGSALTMGFSMTADAPVAVFSGTDSTYLPLGTGFADPLEEQLIPLSAWGTRYVGARHPQRLPEDNPEPEEVLWRVVAAADATEITLTPGVAGDSVFLANAGDWYEFMTRESFLAESAPDKPFMLVQFMTGMESIEGGWPDPSGDPYMMQMIPIEQWVTELPFITPIGAHDRDFVFVTREAGTIVDLACLGTIPDERFTPVSGTGYEVGWVDLDAPGGGEGDCVDGQQFIVSESPIGVHVGGVSHASSYGYPGGLNLDPLWTPPDPAG